MADMLSAQQQRQYRDTGIVFPIPVLSPDQAGHFRRACDQLEQQLGGKPRTIEVRQMHLHFRWAFDLATAPGVLDAVESLLGPDILIWASELFAKHPQDTAISIGWHRDQPYLGFDPNLAVTAWIALGNSTRENGCMRVAVEPNRQEAALNEIRVKERSRNKVNVAEEQILDVALRSGEMSLHDAHVLHGSGPNLSSENRVGVALRFISPAARPLSDDASAVLVRGTDRFGRFRLLEPPPQESVEDALDQMKRSAARHLDATLRNLKCATT